MDNVEEIVSDGTVWGSPEWYAARWESVPKTQRKKIVDHLKKLDNLRDIYEGSRSDPWFHHSSGVMLRNYLRRVVRDDQLPAAPYPNGMSYTNWDDFYLQALKEAVSEF